MSKPKCPTCGQATIIKPEAELAESPYKAWLRQRGDFPNMDIDVVAEHLILEVTDADPFRFSNALSGNYLRAVWDQNEYKRQTITRIAIAMKLPAWFVVYEIDMHRMAVRRIWPDDSIWRVQSLSKHDQWLRDHAHPRPGWPAPLDGWKELSEL